MRTIAAGVAIVCLAAAIALGIHFTDKGRVVTAEEVAGLFGGGRGAVCTSETRDGVGEWTCNLRNDSVVSVQVEGDGSYSSSGTGGNPALAGCCLGSPN